MTPENIERLLRLTGFEYTESIWWRLGSGEHQHDDQLHFFVNCNDAFLWACADCEEVTDENIDSLIETVTEVEEIVGKYSGHDGFLLWVCRVRKMRPQGAMYKHLDPPLWDLFDAAGPERETDFGNPVSAETGKAQHGMKIHVQSGEQT